MGTYRSFKVSVAGKDKNEVKYIRSLVEADEELKLSLDKWDCNIKNWTPHNKLADISSHCEKSYILLDIAITEYGASQEIVYQGIFINGAHPDVKRLPPITGVKKLAEKIRKRS